MERGIYYPIVGIGGFPVALALVILQVRKFATFIFRIHFAMSFYQLSRIWICFDRLNLDTCIELGFLLAPRT